MSQTKNEGLLPNLQRGLDTLELLSKHPQGLILSDICKRLSIPKNSGMRMMNTLTYLGYTHRNDKLRTFTLTKKLLKLSCAVLCERNLIEEAIDDMRYLRDKTSETVLLETMIEHQGVVLATMPGLHPIRLVIDAGSRFELYCSAGGKVALSYMSEAQRNITYTKTSWKVHTPTTLSSAVAMDSQISQIRNQGYAIDDSENEAHSYCVSAPIFDKSRRYLASLTVSGLAYRMPPESRATLPSLVMKHARRIQERLQ